MATPQDLLRQLTRLGGLAQAAAAGARIIGGDPIVRTELRAAETGAAAIAASGMAAAWLWRLSTGEAQDVEVDAVAATAAMQSYKFLKLNGEPPGAAMDRLTNAYRLKDGGWIYLHCNFSNLAAKNCQALGADPTPESMRAQALKWEGQALEDAVLAAGGCGSLVRSEAQWRTHPQGIAVAQEPPLEIVRIGDAPPEALPGGSRPLSGVRVLDFTRVLAGPTCAKNLAEHGAEVLKIAGPGMPDSGALDLDTGLGKRHASLDLRDATERLAVHELARGCDVFSQAYRPGALAAHGLSPEDLARLRPGIVYVTLNAWGFTGPWRDLRGYDTVVQAANGMAWQGRDHAPAFTPVAQQDYVAGYLMAFGAMAALARRVEEGGSWMVRVSLAACGEWIRAAGRIPPIDYQPCPLQVPDDAVQPWITTSPYPGGLLTHLGPVTRMSRTPARWETPPPAGTTSCPAWNPRRH